MSKAYRLERLSAFSKVLLETSNTFLMPVLEEYCGEGSKRKRTIFAEDEEYRVNIYNVPMPLFCKALTVSLMKRQAELIREMIPDKECEEYCETILDKGELMLLREESDKSVDPEAYVVVFLEDGKPVLDVLLFERKTFEEIFEIV